MLFRQSLATVRRPALYTMSSWLKDIPSCARTRSMKAVFFCGVVHPTGYPDAFILIFMKVCEKTSFASGLNVHSRLIVVARFVDCYDDVPDGHCFLQLDRDPRTRETPFAIQTPQTPQLVVSVQARHSTNINLPLM